MSGRNDDHLVALPGTDWTVWRDGVLRSAGFPAGGLDRFAGPDTGEAWLPDAAGQRYFSELRIHMVDPVPAGPTAEQ